MNSTLLYSNKILVVDDDPGVTKYLETLLTRRGYAVIVAHSGEEALDKVGKEDPDLVLLDIMMPEMDGYEVCKKIRESSQIPIVFLSAKGREEDIIKGLEFKADDYLPKPFPSKLLVVKIRAILESRGRYRRLEAEYHKLKEKFEATGEEVKASKVYSKTERYALAHLIRREKMEVKMDVKLNIEPEIELEPKELLPVLKRIEAEGFAIREEVDNHLVCPRCGSFNTKPSFCCPTCRIKNLDRAAVIEHLKCGNLAKSDAFEKGGKLICPKCRGELHTMGVDYRRIGNWFSCLEGHFFGVPWIVYRCNKCDLDFPLEEGSYVNLYRYSINPERLPEAGKISLDYELLQDRINRLGFNGKFMGKLNSASGIELEFDFVVLNKSENFVIDFNTSYGEMQEEKILQFIAKVVELKPKAAIFASLCKLLPSVRQIADNYGIKVIVEEDFQKIVRGIESHLNSD